jgi:hypothetical protein
MSLEFISCERLLIKLLRRLGELNATAPGAGVNESLRKTCRAMTSLVVVRHGLGRTRVRGTCVLR